MKYLITALLAITLCWVSVSGGATLSMAKSLYSKGEIAPALTEIKGLLVAEPDNTDALFLQAQLLYEAGQLKQSIRAYQSIIESNPAQLEAYNNLAAIYAQHDNLQAASEVLEKAMHVDPVYATLYDNLRAVYWDMSKRHVRAALKLKRTNNPAQLATIESPLPDTVLDTTTTTLIPITEPKTEPKTELKTETKKPAKVVAKVEKKTEAMVTKNVPKDKPAPTLTDEQKVKSLINRWAAAWSSKNAVKYVSFYSSAYHSVGKSRKQWIAGRRWNFKSKKYIKVKADKLKTRKSGGSYITQFRQSYESDLYRDKVLKELHFVRQNGDWKISQEITLKAL